MFVTLTSSKVNSEQAAQVESFLRVFLPRLKREQKGVVAILHFANHEKGEERTLIVWESQEAIQDYRNGELIKEPMALEERLGLASTREGFALTLGLGLTAS